MTSSSFYSFQERRKTTETGLGGCEKQGVEGVWRGAQKEKTGGACWLLHVVPPEPPESTEGGRKKVELRVPGSPFLAPSSEKIHWC